MKLLIVDDEKLTREGLLTAVNWEELGITEIDTAANGEEGLSIGKTFHPDMVLTDVRMPRMTGIEMAEELQQIYPDTAVIFMSGYSDKEYLKAAIKLNAVSYVEKPINLKEVVDAVREASMQIEEKQMAARGQKARETEEKVKLCERIMHGIRPKDFSDLSLPRDMHETDSFCALVTEFEKSERISFAELSTKVLSELSLLLKDKKQNIIYAVREGHLLCLFVYGVSVNKENMAEVIRFMRKSCDYLGNFTQALGTVVSGMGNAYLSYTSAVALLQQAFYCEENSDLFELEEPRYTPPAISDHSAEFSEALKKRDRAGCDRILSEVEKQFMMPCMLLPSQTRDIYYKLFIQLQKAAEQSRIASFLIEEKNSLFDMVNEAPSCPALHRLLRERVADFFDQSENHREDNSLVYAIEEFVHMNYQNESLSVKSISDYVNRSTSYVCTLFKNESGMTLNQYITKYRLENAKEMLGDPRYKITEVASRCGYNDVNYFGKIFKKYTGSSPSEYRGGLL